MLGFSAVRVFAALVGCVVLVSTLAAADAVGHPKLRIKVGLAPAGATVEVNASTATSDTASHFKLYPRGYSALVAFGASYMDNAHRRSKKYATSFRDKKDFPFSFHRRYTNGPVAVEYMVKPSTVPALRPYANEPPVLFDFAYGGSVIKNNLTGTAGLHNIPDLGREIKQYLQQLDDEVIETGRGRVLHVIHTGTNPISQMWMHALTANISRARTRKSITKQVIQMSKYIRHLATHDLLRDNVVVADYLIVGIPPLGLVPNLSFNYISAFPHHSAAQRAAALEYAGELADQFNLELRAFTSTLKEEVRAGSRVMYYELANLFKTIYRYPRNYGITAPVTQACWNSSAGVLCNNPENHFYIDTLHITTTAHKIWASKMNHLVNKVAGQAHA
ncbi:BQ2448_2460 [Microbotryum intermedium]|uniref:BQ2448_2460 protein n=1 Tax=Microbotryum intermedium TaxID=269621 RepID=A0A238F6D9_9BASI|nr:BQ2448_2460 [Microbotryum intermedium]